MKQKSFKTARIIKPGIEYRGTRTVASGRLRRSSWKNALSRHAGVLSAARKSYIIEPAGTSVSVCARARLRERERDRGSSPFSVASSLYQERESDGESPVSCTHASLPNASCRFPQAFPQCARKEPQDTKEARASDRAFSSVGGFSLLRAPRQLCLICYRCESLSGHVTCVSSFSSWL
jgi:hypothetical protein